MAKRSNFLDFFAGRERGFRESPWGFLSSVFQRNKAYYAKNLKAHFGCVNAIEFSRNDALFASGGDDMRVLIWKLGEALIADYTPSVPVKMNATHSSNVFCLEFNCHDELVISGGNDGCVIVHEINTGEHLDTYLTGEAVYSITADPVNPSVFIASTHHSKAIVYDTRCSEDVLEFESSGGGPLYTVQYNPVHSQYVASICSNKPAQLWDIRKVSSPFLQYKYNIGTYQGMGLAFNRWGDRLLTIGRRMPPLVYDWLNEKPLHQLTNTGFYCSCTIKSCCWAGPNDEFVTVGSDNFKVYMWQIPKHPTPDNYLVTKACRELNGHRSIVNQVRYNSSYSVLASSGVEKVIKMWSALNITNRDDSHMYNGERCVYSHQEYISLMLRDGTGLSHNYADESMEEDTKMIAFFDSIMQRELQASSDSSASEEASQRRYNYEISSTSSSSSPSSPVNTTHTPTTTRRRVQIESDSTSEEGGELTDYNEAILRTVLDLNSDPTNNNPTDGELPSGSITMTELISRRNQQDRKKVLALEQKHLRRRQRKAALAAGSQAKQDGDSEASDSDIESHRRCSKSRMRKVLRRKKMKRILHRLALSEIEAEEGENTHLQTEQTQLDLRLAPSQNSMRLSQMNSLRRTRSDSDMEMGGTATSTTIPHSPSSSQHNNDLASCSKNPVTMINGETMVNGENCVSTNHCDTNTTRNNGVVTITTEPSTSNGQCSSQTITKAESMFKKRKKNFGGGKRRYRRNSSSDES